MDIYEPQEDSFLLQNWVRKKAKGRCLDVGTGSGIQAKTALEVCSEVIGVDLNPSAVAECRKQIPEAHFFVSDLFSYFEEQQDKKAFDTIIFNAPYLPDEESAPDLALDGGKEGHELIARFLREAKSYLAKEGSILLLFSSHTGKEQVDKEIEKNRYTHKELETLHIFFEDMYCYEVKHA